MPRFGSRSKKRLEECHPRLQEIMNELIKIMDVTILCGVRGKDEQNQAFNNGKSQLKFPQSKHNLDPHRNPDFSLAVDVAPWPIDWNDINRFERMCGIIEGIAAMKGTKIRLGRDFSFNDYPHIELI